MLKVERQPICFRVEKLSVSIRIQSIKDGKYWKGKKRTIHTARPDSGTVQKEGVVVVHMFECCGRLRAGGWKIHLKTYCNQSICLILRVKLVVKKEEAVVGPTFRMESTLKFMLENDVDQTIKLTL